MESLEKSFINSLGGYAIVRDMETGNSIICNDNYQKKFKSKPLDECIKANKSYLIKANLTFCAHLDEIFKDNKKTLFAKEIFNCKTYISMRTLIHYNNRPSILVIINEIKSDDEIHANIYSS